MGNDEAGSGRRYQVDVEKRAGKILISIKDRVLKERLIEAIDGLQFDPRPPGCKKIAHRREVYRG